MAVRKDLFGSLIAFILTGCTSASTVPLQRRIIVIDPGHGGIHRGAVGPSGIMEKDVTLEVARVLQQVLTAWGAETVLTRSKDVALSPDDIEADLAERRSIRDRTKPDLFISIHINYSPDPYMRGFEVWIPREGVMVQGSREFAEFICTHLGAVWGNRNRGIKDQRNLRVLKAPPCPATLVELEFISNPDVEKDLAKAHVQRRLAEALAEAIRKYCERP